MNPAELAVAQKSLVSANKTDVILKRMKKSVNRDAALAQNKETIAGLVILSYQNPPLPPVGPDPETPLAPATYTIPGGATSVSTGAQLVTQLAGTTPKDIVCEDGTYTHTSFFSNPYGHRIYARNVGGVISTSGFSFTGGDGGIVRGFNFDITSTSKCDLNASIVAAYSFATNVSVLDCRVDGNDVCNWGIRYVGATVGGAIIERCFVEHLKEDGIRLVQTDTKFSYQSGSAVTITSLTDIDVDYCYRGAAGTHNGTGEFGLWIQNKVTTANRIRANRCYWGGINTLSNSWDTTFTNITVTGGASGFYPTACYLEHFNQNNKWEGFIFTGCGNGFWGEWADPGWGGIHAMILPITFKNGTIDGTGVPSDGGSYGTGSCGINIDYGGPGPTIQNVHFKNLNWAAIGHYGGTSPISYSALDFTNCDVNYTTSHKNNPTPSSVALP